MKPNLIAMVAAQQANEKIDLDIPIYGVYVSGRFFYFAVLYKKNYALSEPYIASQADIFKIFVMFRKLKTYMETLKPKD